MWAYPEVPPHIIHPDTHSRCNRWLVGNSLAHLEAARGKEGEADAAAVLEGVSVNISPTNVEWS